MDLLFLGQRGARCRAFSDCFFAFAAGLALLAICLMGLGYLVINLVVGLVHTDGTVPFDFTSFCVFLVFDLSLVILVLSTVVEKVRGVNFRVKSSKNVVLAMLKAMLISILSGAASQLGGWIGGVIVMALLAGAASLFNFTSPAAEATE